jgi:hypothetical protein
MDFERAGAASNPESRALRSIVDRSDAFTAQTSRPPFLLTRRLSVVGGQYLVGPHSFAAYLFRIRTLKEAQQAVGTSEF